MLFWRLKFVWERRSGAIRLAVVWLATLYELRWRTLSRSLSLRLEVTLVLRREGYFFINLGPLVGMGTSELNLTCFFKSMFSFEEVRWCDGICPRRFSSKSSIFWMDSKGLRPCVSFSEANVLLVISSSSVEFLRKFARKIERILFLANGKSSLPWLNVFDKS